MERHAPAIRDGRGGTCRGWSTTARKHTVRRQVNLRLSDLTRGQLAELCRQLAASEATIVTVAIDRMYQIEIINRSALSGTNLSGTNLSGAELDGTGLDGIDLQ